MSTVVHPGIYWRCRLRARLPGPVMESSRRRPFHHPQGPTVSKMSRSMPPPMRATAPTRAALGRADSADSDQSPASTRLRNRLGICR